MYDKLSVIRITILLHLIICCSLFVGGWAWGSAVAVSSNCNCKQSVISDFQYAPLALLLIGRQALTELASTESLAMCVHFVPLCEDFCSHATFSARNVCLQSLGIVSQVGTRKQTR